MTVKSRVEENLEAREILFNMYAINQGMNYIDDGNIKYSFIKTRGINKCLIYSK